MTCSYAKLAMTILGDLRVLLLGLASITNLLGQADAREIIRHAVAADERNWRIARNYTYLQRVELRRLDAQGSVKLSEVETYDVTLPGGTPYRQLVQRDDRPLPPAEEKRERESLARSIAERQQETGTERAQRLSAYERRPDWQREAWHELPDAFDFRLAGEGSLEGHSIFIIEAMPRQGYQPRSRTARLFRSLKGRFWVDQQDHQLMRLEVEVIDTISVGLFLVRVAIGSRATLELTCLRDGAWLPDSLQVSGSARLGLLKALRIERNVHYSRYSSVPADAGTIYPAAGRDARGARLNRFAQATSHERSKTTPAMVLGDVCSKLAQADDEWRPRERSGESTGSGWGDSIGRTAPFASSIDTTAVAPLLTCCRFLSHHIYFD